MLRSIIFEGSNSFSWDGTVRESPDEKFNRWMEANSNHISIDSVIYKDQGEHSSLCVLYTHDNHFSNKLLYLEEGKYFVNRKSGKLINLQYGIDVSYMVKNFSMFETMMTSKLNYCVSVLKDGKFIYTFDYWTEVPAPHRPIEVNRIRSLGIEAEYVIKKEFLPKNYTLVKLNKGGSFSFSENAGIYEVDILHNTLIKSDNNLDVTYTVEFMGELTRRVHTPKYRKKDCTGQLNCDGKYFIFLNEDKEDKTPEIKIPISEAIFEGYL